MDNWINAMTNDESVRRMLGEMDVDPDKLVANLRGDPDPVEYKRLVEHLRAQAAAGNEGAAKLLRDHFEATENELQDTLRRQRLVEGEISRRAVLRKLGTRPIARCDFCASGDRVE